MAIIVTFAHHKGGTGKTTTAINVAGFAALSGSKVLVVDIDPQANTTSGLGIDTTTVGASMFDVLTGKSALQDVLLETDCGVHLAPATLDLVGAEPWLYGLENGRIQQLSRVLSPLRDSYDLVAVDTPPGAGVLMLNGLAAADRVVLTLDPGVFALEDVKTFKTLLEDVSQATGEKKRADFAVVTRAIRPGLWDAIMGRSDTVGDLVSELSKTFPSIHVVPYDRAIFESQRLGVPLSHLSPGTPAGRAYGDLTSEVMNHG